MPPHEQAEYGATQLCSVRLFGGHCGGLGRVWLRSQAARCDPDRHRPERRPGVDPAREGRGSGGRDHNDTVRIGEARRFRLCVCKAGPLRGAVGLGKGVRVREARDLREAARVREAGDVRPAGCIREEVEMRALLVACLVLGCRESKPAEPSTTTPSAAPAEVSLKVGDDAPSTPKLDIASYKGKHVVVYFYPKDDTPGCTKEACAFRDAWAKLSKANVQVIGVSVDDEESHRKFVEKYKLPFPLIADTDKSICKAYGVPVTMGYASRVSYLVGPNGKIKKVYPKVDPGVHADEILADAV